MYEIIRRLNAEAPLDTTVGQGSPQATAIVGETADADTVAVPDGAPVLARDENADTVASAEEAKEDAPVVWPTPSIPEPPPASGLHPAYLLALLFGFIALVCFFGPVVIERLARVRFERRHGLRGTRSGLVHAPIAPPTAPELYDGLTPPESSRQMDDALQWLSRAAGAARREHRVRAALATSH